MRAITPPPPSIVFRNVGCPQYVYVPHTHTPSMARERGLSAAEERKQRLIDLMWTVQEFGGRLYRGALASAACREWPVSKKTAEEYIQSLVDAEWVEMAAGVTVVLTDRGRDYLGRNAPRVMVEADLPKNP